MYSKIFTRLFLLMGMIGLMSVPLRAEEVTIGSGTTTNAWLPSHSYYKYSLTQQIYTADEIGGAGTINSIAFYNGGSEKHVLTTFTSSIPKKTRFPVLPIGFQSLPMIWSSVAA